MPVERSDDPWVMPDPLASSKRPVPPTTTHLMVKTEVRPSAAFTSRNVPRWHEVQLVSVGCGEGDRPRAEPARPRRHVDEGAVRDRHGRAAEVQELARPGRPHSARGRPPDRWLVRGEGVRDPVVAGEEPHMAGRRDRRGERETEGGRDQHSHPGSLAPSRHLLSLHSVRSASGSPNAASRSPGPGSSFRVPGTPTRSGPCRPSARMTPKPGYVAAPGPYLHEGDDEVVLPDRGRGRRGLEVLSSERLDPRLDLLETRQTSRLRSRRGTSRRSHRAPRPRPRRRDCSTRRPGPS